MRDSLSSYLPNEIKNRKDKKGFITPEEKWVKIENPQLFRKLLEKSIEYSNGILNENILEYFDNMVAGSVPFDYTYWRYIQFGFWMKAFKVRNAA
jgi:asparagine synthase (glutamine-hydrolysing)